MNNKSTIQAFLTIVSVVVIVSKTYAAGPVITKIEPTKGQVGERFKIVGENFKGTHSVVFLVGKTFRPVKFQNVSPNELEATVPEFYRPNAEAIVFVQSNNGIAVTCPITAFVVNENQPRKLTQGHPRAEAAFLHVLKSGLIRESFITTLIEDGGHVTQALGCPLILVKNGGYLGFRESEYIQTIYHEPKARLEKGHENRPNHRSVIAVKEINVAEGVGPFVYLRKPPDPDLLIPKSVPAVTSIGPVNVAPGAVVRLIGNGFSGTSSVYFASGKGSSPFSVSEVGFQIDSDNQLVAEVPDEIQTASPAEFIVINSEGMTITNSPWFPSSEKMDPPDSHKYPHLMRITKGNVSEELQSAYNKINRIWLVEAGGTMRSHVLGGVVLVKDGGTLVNVSGKVFYEANANLPEGTIKIAKPGRPQSLVFVPKIEVSSLKTSLQIADPKPWKK